jgi:hypothetical protein
MDQTRTATVFGISRERCSDAFEEARQMHGSGLRLEVGRAISRLLRRRDPVSTTTFKV